MKNIKKLLSLLLCGIMLFGMFPASLFAAAGDTGDGSGPISETLVPVIKWKRTFQYETFSLSFYGLQNGILCIHI